MLSGTVSGVITAVLLAMFVVGCVWAFSPRRKRDFDDAARLPLLDGDVRGDQTNEGEEKGAPR